jgi:hypothetical protein
LPDSEICGSTAVSAFPQLFAAVHVLHRLSTPRHPPRALSSFSLSLRHVLSTRRSGFRTRTPARIPKYANELLFHPASVNALMLLWQKFGFYGVLFNCQGASIRNAASAFVGPRKISGAERDRTDDLRLAKPALSQLSYSPVERPRLGDCCRLLAASNVSLRETDKLA